MAKQTTESDPNSKTAAKAALSSPAGARRANGARQGVVLELQRDIEQFLYRQSGILDNKRWEDYIALFAEDGLYWMPPAPHYTTWEGQPAIFIEDPDLMTVRMKRLQHPHAWSQAAEWATNHVVSNVEIESVEANGDVHVASRFHMMELRRDDLRHFGGTYHHHLVKTADGYRIKLQRVDMFNAQAPYEYVLQIWV